MIRWRWLCKLFLRKYHIFLPKVPMWPMSSKTHQVEILFLGIVCRVKATPQTVVLGNEWFEFEIYYHAQCTDFLGSLSYSFKIRMIYHVHIKDHEQWIVHNERWTGRKHAHVGNDDFLTDQWSNQGKLYRGIVFIIMQSISTIQEGA